jgi:hypothetical protein
LAAGRVVSYAKVQGVSVGLILLISQSLSLLTCWVGQFLSNPQAQPVSPPAPHHRSDCYWAQRNMP